MLLKVLIVINTIIEGIYNVYIEKILLNFLIVIKTIIERIYNVVCGVYTIKCFDRNNSIIVTNMKCI